jgi:DNA-binding response OmpR family regulator
VDEVTRVLVADGDEPTRNLVQLTFAGPDWQVAEAADVEGLVRAVAAGVPHVILIDADLPHVGGLAAARALRQQPATAGASVLLLTDLTRPVAPGDLAESQVDAVLERPFGSFDLFEAVEELLQRR